MATAEDNFRVEIWTDDETSLLETISRSSDITVSTAAWHAAIRKRPGALLVHRNQQHVMERMVAPGQRSSADETRVDATLDDLRYWHGVRAWCTSCSHHSWIKVDDLKKRVGGQMLFSEVECKMTCTKCRQGPIRLEVHTVKRD